MNQKSKDLELDNYRVLHKEDQSLWVLGKGGYGTTYKAEHKHLGRICALKVINDNLMSNNKIRRRFLQEAQAAAALSHPNIAIVHDFGESDGVFYYAMEFCSGGDLEEFSRSRGAQPWSVVKGLAMQILAALSEAHGKGLLHRDLKPSNIMLADSDGSVNLRLIDFGLVKVLDHHQSASTNLMLTQDGGFLGNPLTASPEQLQEDHLDERSDLFSVGVTLWYLLVGGSPFGQVSTAKLVHQRLSVDNYMDLLPVDLDDSGRYIIGKLLNKNREDRFSSAEEVIKAIHRADQGGSISNDPPIEPDSEVSVLSENLTENVPSGQRVNDWSEIWRIQEQLHKFSYGTYYACVGLKPGVPVTTLFIPDQKFSDCSVVCSYADKLVETSTLLLSGFYKKGLLEGETAYACPPFSLGTLSHLLQATGNLSLQNHLMVFQQIALAVDEAIKLEVPGVELEIADVILGLRDRSEGIPLNEDEWSRYFQQKKDQGEDFVANLEFTVIPKLVDSAGTEEAMVTLGDDDLATTPLARFGGLIYRSISGMAVKQAAYLTSSAHVSTPHASEKTNQYLCEVIAAEEKPSSAMAFLEELCELEGVRWSLDIVEATQAAKESEKHAITRDYASIGGGLTLSRMSQPTQMKESVKESVVPVDDVAKTATEPALPAKEEILPVKEEALQVPPPEPNISQQTSIFASELSKEENPPLDSQPVLIEKSDQKQRVHPLKNKWTVVAVVCVVFLVGGYLMMRDSGKNRRSRSSGENDARGMVDHGDAALIKIVFSDVDMSEVHLPQDSIISLCDTKEVTVASLRVAGQTAESLDFPQKMFDEKTRWPIEVRLAATGFTMEPVSLKYSDFKNLKEGGKKYKKQLKLQPRAYLAFDPVVNFESNALTDYNELLMGYLYPLDASVDWTIKMVGEKITVTLPPGRTFPIDAVLTVPYMTEITSSLAADENLQWDLEVKKKEVYFAGLGQFQQLSFKPNFDKVENPSIRQTLREHLADFTIDSSEFVSGSGKWNLPELDGTVEATGGSEPWSIPLNAATKYRVITKGTSSEISDADFKKKKKQAEMGDRDAQYELGLNYLNGGEGVEVNKGASTAWFRIAAERGDHAAQQNLGLAYEHGTGVDVNKRAAVQWYIKASNQGNADAKICLGMCSQKGRGVPQDYKKAEEWYLKAVDQGNAQAMYNLAILYVFEEFGMTDIEKAIPLFQRAVDLEHAGAMYNLAYYHLYGKGGLEVNLPKAKELYRKAAEKNHPKAKEALEILESEYGKE